MAGGYMKEMRRNIVDWVNGKAPTAPGNWFVGLSTADPADDMSAIAEPTATGGYTRTADILTGGWTAAPSPANNSPAVGANASTVSFPVSSAAWSTTTTALPFFFISKSSSSTTSANAIARGALTPSTTTVNAAGITLSFAAAALTLNLTPV